MLSRAQLENHQVKIYIVVLLIAFSLGLTVPHYMESLEIFLTPILALLMYSMMTQIPFTTIKNSFLQTRFLLVICLLNFLIVPMIVWLLAFMLPNDPVLLLGFYLVLLTPCIDYVVVFTALGKGDERAMLAATPLLFILQLCLLPLYLWLFLGKQTVLLIDIAPFIKSFFWLIILPFALAFFLQLFTPRLKWAKKTLEVSAWLPVPFMALTLFIIIASQMNHLKDQFEIIKILIPLYLLFMMIMPFIAKGLSAAFKLPLKQRRAAIFSSSTRNSLVVLAIALSLPPSISVLVAAIILTQTIVELIVEVIYIRIIPNWLLRDDA